MRWASLAVGLVVVSLSSAPAMASQASLARKLQAIEKACNLSMGTITAIGEEVHFAPSPSEKYEHIDCALAKLKKGHFKNLGFVGNEADPNAMLEEPYRYIVQGAIRQIADLSAAARLSGWIIVKSATADDGTSFLLIQTRQGETVGGAEELMKRIWQKDFGELLLGRAPEPLGEPTNDLQH